MKKIRENNGITRVENSLPGNPRGPGGPGGPGAPSGPGGPAAKLDNLIAVLKADTWKLLRIMKLNILLYIL